MRIAPESAAAPVPTGEEADLPHPAMQIAGTSQTTANLHEAEWRKVTLDSLVIINCTPLAPDSPTSYQANVKPI